MKKTHKGYFYSLFFCVVGMNSCEQSAPAHPHLHAYISQLPTLASLIWVADSNLQRKHCAARTMCRFYVGPAGTTEGILLSVRVLPVYSYALIAC